MRSNQFGRKIKNARLKVGLLQQDVAFLLDIDGPMLSKIEKGERCAKKEQIKKLAEILNTDENQLITLWLADQVFDVIKDESMADEALKSVSRKIKKKK